MFFDFLCGLFFVFPLYLRVGFCLIMGLTFLWPIPWFPLFLAMSYCYSYYNNLILLGLFWASRLFLLLVAWHGHWFAFTFGLLCPFGLSFGPGCCDFLDLNTRQGSLFIVPAMTGFYCFSP